MKKFFSTLRSPFLKFKVLLALVFLFMFEMYCSGATLSPETIQSFKAWKLGLPQKPLWEVRDWIFSVVTGSPQEQETLESLLGLLADTKVDSAAKLQLMEWMRPLWSEKEEVLLYKLAEDSFLAPFALHALGNLPQGSEKLIIFYEKSSFTIQNSILIHFPTNDKKAVDTIAQKGLDSNDLDLFLVSLSKLTQIKSSRGVEAIARELSQSRFSKNRLFRNHASSYLMGFMNDSAACEALKKMSEPTICDVAGARAVVLTAPLCLEFLQTPGPLACESWIQLRLKNNPVIVDEISKKLDQLPLEIARYLINYMGEGQVVSASGRLQNYLSKNPDSDPELQTAAYQALAKIGGESNLNFLLSELIRTSGKRDPLRRALLFVRDPNFNSLLGSKIESTQEPATVLAFMNVAGDRYATELFILLQKKFQKLPPSMQALALQSLTQTATINDLPSLLELFQKSAPETNETWEKALGAYVPRLTSSLKKNTLILAALQSLPNEKKAVMIKVAGATGDLAFVPVLVQLLDSSEKTIRSASIKALGSIKSEEAIEPLLNSIEKQRDKLVRKLMIREVAESMKSVVLTDQDFERNLSRLVPQISDIDEARFTISLLMDSNNYKKVPRKKLDDWLEGFIRINPELKKEVDMLNAKI